MYYLFDNMKVLAESVEKKDGFVPANWNNPDGSRQLDHGHISQSNDKTLGRILRRTFTGRPSSAILFDIINYQNAFLNYFENKNLPTNFKNDAEVMDYYTKKRTSA